MDKLKGEAAFVKVKPLRKNSWGLYRFDREIEIRIP
jgi:hypothetical protein